MILPPLFIFVMGDDRDKMWALISTAGAALGALALASFVSWMDWMPNRERKKPAVLSALELKKRLIMHEFNEEEIEREVKKIEDVYGSAVGPAILRHGVPASVNQYWASAIQDVVEGVDVFVSLQRNGGETGTTDKVIIQEE